MSPKSILLLVTFLLCTLAASSQYTEKINSNRPGTSQGAFSVGNNVLQLEGGLGFGKEKHKILDTKTNVFNFDYSVRYGLLIEQLEIRLNGRYRADGVTQTVGANEQKINRSNFEINTIGAKYLIYDPYKPKLKKKDTVPANYDSLKSWKERYRFKWKSLIPAVSGYAGVNFVAKDNPFTFPEDPSISPIFVVATQNNWSTSYGGDWAFVTNLIIDKITTENPAFGLILTATHTVNNKWAGFAEYQVQKSDFYSDNIMRLGGAYLYNQDVQFDANIAFNFKDTPSIFTLSFGASYRFDWHTKDEIIEQPGLEGGVKEGEEDEEGKEGKEGDSDDNREDDSEEDSEIEGVENDSLKLEKTPFINDFEDDSFREELERDLDERRTEERLERERIENEKIQKKEDKKFKKEEARRLKREAKAAREAEKEAIKAEKEKQKMIEDIDAELDKMEQDQGVDDELDDIEKQLQELEKMEKELEQEEKKDQKKDDKEEKAKEKEKKEEEVDVDAEYEKYQQEKEKARKEEEKRRKKEEKRREKEEKKRQKEEKKRKKNEEDNSDSDNG
ncbi:transporter [Aquimarina sp. D1M17]|uniref:transporter n=1 Tax=Aquimarina acroporae TaxID=2937283 RepID=UPI0020BDD49F|nr:transporter [Aquimarina acroporae]MCK8524371.1 transporter [Aquimarina acroporae]